MTDILQTSHFFDLLRGEESLLVLQHLEKYCRVQRHTTLHSIIPHIIFLHHAKKSFCVFLELLEVLQRAKTAISANIAFHIYTGDRNIQYTAKFCFTDPETFPFNFIFLLQSFSSKPHKTQPVFVGLNLVGVTSMACVPSIQSKFSQINKLI